MVKKFNVSVIGATGMAGQQFMEALINHPWFDIVSLHGHSSVGKKYENSIRGFTSFDYPEDILEIKVRDTKDIDVKNVDIIFSEKSFKESPKKMQQTVMMNIVNYNI